MARGAAIWRIGVGQLASDGSTLGFHFSGSRPLRSKTQEKWLSEVECEDSVFAPLDEPVAYLAQRQETQMSGIVAFVPRR